jgi:hypothetical protein
MELSDIEWRGINWIIWLRVVSDQWSDRVNTAMNLQFPLSFGKILE